MELFLSVCHLGQQLKIGVHAGNFFLISCSLLSCMRVWEPYRPGCLTIRSIASFRNVKSENVLLITSGLSGLCLSTKAATSHKHLLHPQWHVVPASLTDISLTSPFGSSTDVAISTDMNSGVPLPTFINLPDR